MASTSRSSCLASDTSDASTKNQSAAQTTLTPTPSSPAHQDLKSMDSSESVRGKIVTSTESKSFTEKRTSSATETTGEKRVENAEANQGKTTGSTETSIEKTSDNTETSTENNNGFTETTNGKRAGSADTATMMDKEAGARKPPRHRRCQSQSIVSSVACATQTGLAVPAAQHYRRSYSEQGFETEGTPLNICDEAISVEEVFGRRGQRLEGLLPRLVLVSSRVRNISVLRHAVLPGISVMQYNYDNQTLDDILTSVSQALNGRLVHSVAFILSCPGPAVQLTAAEEKVVSRETVHDKWLGEFLMSLKDDHCNKESAAGLRFDFLACSGLLPGDASFLGQELEAILGITVGVWRDLIVIDNGNKKGEEPNSPSICVAELYFRLEKLRLWSGRHQQSLAGFEKIRTVGKGAYGAAVLYKKKDDDSLVILKEINMHDLTAAERQLALNEVRVLAMLDHPNIISYFDSFEEDGVLMIEMEYADGGTLAQYLSKQDPALGADREREVLSMFQQIVAAILYIHQHNILHRDLKTENIFLTKEGVVKVGDFGISKMLGSVNKAQTVLGTPYYISPEMCEGKPYSYTSDIWALGCILYEMACLQKTFEGTNLPALVHKIMQGQFAPIKGNYSEDFRQLVSDMLQRDPELRPSANEIMYPRLSKLMKNFDTPTSDPEDELMTSTESVNHRVKVRSVLYYLESSTGHMTCITGLPPRMKIKQVGVSSDHVVVVTMERQVYSWGRGDKGQLGHGDVQGRSSPCLVEALKGKSITMACCGEDFSAFCSDNGLVLTCGNGASGCLGHGDWSTALKPRLIEILLSVDVVVVSCGPHHMAVVGREGEVYSWGQGDRGQLGLGTEENHCQPKHVKMEEAVVIKDIQCGVDCTMFITDMGGVFACGSNEFNKLGLNNRQGFLMAMKNIFTKTEVEGRNVPTPVRALARHRVVAVAMGRHHSAVIVEAGHVYTFGRNMEGQLGTGNVKAFHAPVELKSLSHVSINHVRCGDHYTVASSRDHQLFYWGLRYTAALPRFSDDNSHNTTTTTTTTDEGSSRSSISSLPVEPEGTSVTATASAVVVGGIGVGEGTEEVTPRNILPEDEVDKGKKKEGSDTHYGDELFSASESSNSSVREANPEHPRSSATLSGNHGDSGISIATAGSGEGTETGATLALMDSGAGFRPLSDTLARRSFSAGSRDNCKDKESDKEKEQVLDDSVILFEPTEIIRIKQGHEKVLLGNVFCHGENLFIQVETTAPPPRRRTFKKRSFRRRPQLSEAGRDTKHLSTSSHEAGDEYSSEASEIDLHNTAPTWLREEMIANCQEGLLCHLESNIDDDGNEADNTSDLSDDDSNCRRVDVDSSMSSIHINRVLTPVKCGDGGPTPRSNKPFLPSALKASGRPRTSSVNSFDGNPDRTSTEHMSDSSSSEAAKIKGVRGSHSQVEESTLPGSRAKNRVSSVVPPRLRSAGRGKGKSHQEALKERLVATGFVSNVTVKRREEALLCELELAREEKRKAELQLHALHKELQKENARQEAEQQARAREQQLVAEVERLRQELQKQNSQLAERQQLVGHLQKQLQLNRPPEAWSKNSSTPSGVPHLDVPAPSPQLLSSSSSSHRGNISTRSTSSSSKVCSMQ